MAATAAVPVLSATGLLVGQHSAAQGARQATSLLLLALPQRAAATCWLLLPTSARLSCCLCWALLCGCWVRSHGWGCQGLRQRHGLWGGCCGGRCCLRGWRGGGCCCPVGWRPRCGRLRVCPCLMMTGRTCIRCSVCASELGGAAWWRHITLLHFVSFVRPSTTFVCE